MRRHYIILVAVFAALLCGCNFERNETPPALITFESYKDIPGVTAEEILAIERIKETRSEFSYGVNITTEAFISSEGKVDGFARLLTERLSGLFGIPFIPQAFGWDVLNEKLDAKEIDFTGELSPNPERQQRYFMTAPIFQRTLKIFTNKNSEILSDIARDRPIRCGFLQGSTTYELVRDSWSMPFEPKFIDNEKEAPALLENGTIDAYIDESSAEAIFDPYDFVKAMDYFPLKYSPLSLTTANPELQPFISVIQRYLKNGGFEEVGKLYSAGIKIYSRHRLFALFTTEEMDFLNRHNTPETALLLGVESDNYPMAFYNSQEEKFQGIAVDVLRQVTRFTGLEFKVANEPGVTWPELFSQLQSGQIAIVSELIPSKLREGRFLWTNEPYNIDRYALLSRSDAPNIDINQIVFAKVGLIAETAATELFREWFPDSLNSVVYIDYLSAFNALEKGDIDLLMAPESLLLSLTNYLEKPGFKTNIVFHYNSHSSFGIKKSETLLKSILDKTLRFIDTEGISNGWKRKVFDYESKMLRDMLPYLVGVIVLLVAGFSAVVVLLIKNRRMSSSLESIVAQRTSELEHASRAKSDFLSSMSHEMRTPMNAIIGMAKIAEKTTDPVKMRHCLSTIEVSSTHLLGIINDILDMSKIEAAKFELNNLPLNLESMLMKICNLIADKTDQKAQVFSIVLGKGMNLNYIGDDLRLSQVIANLLSNAVKFTPSEGKISLTVDEIKKGEDRSVLRFSISDTGIGMKEEQIGRLFKAFEQADGSITKRFGGTGLGLAISKNIVEKMNGRIWAESEFGKGSAFIFEVELERLPQAEIVYPFDNMRPSEVKVLVVESDDTTREYFCSIIDQFGMSCHQAGDGGKAVQLIDKAYEENSPYHVIFIAYDLPDTDGLETLKRLKGNVDGNSVVIMASFLEWSRIEVAAIDCGVHRFISKPLFPSSIFNTIGEVLAKPIMNQGSEPAYSSNDRPDFSDVKLLLVEDVEINREIFMTLLEDTGIQIDYAENGREAVQHFEDNPDKYNIIVMDVQMPEMDGYEATRAIRSMDHPKARTVPIVAMTANAFKEDVDKCIESGMNDHIPKPIDEKIIIEKIKLFTKWHDSGLIHG